MIRFRALTADDVECRVSQIYREGLALLLYKNARVDMNVLDETVGPENWQREHYECKGNLFCRVGIRCESEWIWKADCGSESNTEKEKGEASDSFKRACFNWGLGRELYTGPFIWVPSETKDGEPNYKAEEKNGKLTTKDKFDVTYMAVESGKITGLNIENKKKHKTVYVFGNIFPESQKCCVCGKSVPNEIAEKSKAANGGKVFCSGTCRNK